MLIINQKLFYFVDISNHWNHCQSLYEILCWFILLVRAIWLSIKLFVFVFILRIGIFTHTYYFVLHFTWQADWLLLTWT